MSETLSTSAARRLALVQAGLLRADLTDLPHTTGAKPRTACYRIIRRFGYLQLDTIASAGARSHALVLASRLDDLDVELVEDLLRPRAPLFEYWAHEASWVPMELYPAFEFRRREFADGNPWWGPTLKEERVLARDIVNRIRHHGPMRSADLDDPSERNDWGYTRSKRVLRCLWWAGELAVVRRRRFQPQYDLTERVIPARVRDRPLDERDGLKTLLLQALAGHGWASQATIAATWRLRNRKKQLALLLDELREDGRVLRCSVNGMPGWLRSEDVELSGVLSRLRPRLDRGRLLSPFDPVLWDRNRVRQLFGFEQVLEIFKPASKRVYGYYVMPVLAGDHFSARCDVKAFPRDGRLQVLSIHHEGAPSNPAVKSALERHAATLKLKLDLGSPSPLR